LFFVFFVRRFRLLGLATLARLAACLFPLLMKASFTTEKSLSVL
jgi:hypothetical protein